MSVCSSTQRKLCGKKACKICFVNSFQNYKNKTNSCKLKIDCWDYKANGNIKPINIRKYSHKYFWFQCEICNHKFNSRIASITSLNQWCMYCTNQKLCDNNECITCYNKSFSSYKKLSEQGNLIINCFDYINNGNITPRNIALKSAKQYIFICDVCKHSFKKTIYNITFQNTWCCYCCRNPKICGKIDCSYCYNNSFSSYKGLTSQNKLKILCWDDKRNKTKLHCITRSTSSKYYFICDKCSHSFKTTIYTITKMNVWCSYCTNQKLCKDIKCNSCYLRSFASYKDVTIYGKLKINCYNYEKNGDIIPRNISISNDKKFWFTCDFCLNIFKISPASIIRHSWCSICKKKTEKIFLKWLHNNYKYKITYQSNYDWCKSPDSNRYLSYDYVIEDLKLIIEVDGLQHFKQVSNWQTPEHIFEHDNYKMEQAFNKGYSIIRILQKDIYDNKNNWEYKAINAIKLYNIPNLICIGSDILYKKYNNINILNSIKNANIEDKLYNCDKCNINFKFKSQYEKHLKTELHIIGKKKIRVYKKRNRNNNNSYKNKNKHKSQLNRNIFNKLKANKQYKCNKCDVSFKTKHSYDRHCKSKFHITGRRTHNIKKEYKCIHCNTYKTTQKNKLDSHMLKIHKIKENKPFKCDKCICSFKSKYEYERHCKSKKHINGNKIHPIKPKDKFKCQHCDLYTTKQQTNLKLHILNNHKTKAERKEEFPFYCELCDSGTLKDTQFKKHLDTKKHKKKLELSTKK